MSGDVFVVQGDITRFDADVVVCSSSTMLDGGGLSHEAFCARFGLLARRNVGAEPSCPLGPLDKPEAGALLEAVRERRCVLFVGAGLSRGAGLPDRSGLLRELAAALHLELAPDLDRYPLELSLDLALLPNRSACWRSSGAGSNPATPEHEIASYAPFAQQQQ